MTVKKHELEGVRDLLADVMKALILYNTASLNNPQDVAAVIRVTRANIASALVAVSAMVEATPDDG